MDLVIKKVELVTQKVDLGVDMSNKGNFGVVEISKKIAKNMVLMIFSV